MIDGYVMFEVGATTFAVAVVSVREVLRVSDVQLLPSSERTVAGRELALVDARGRAVPVLDLRRDADLAGDVLLAREDDRAGLVVDRVTAVVRPGELSAETAPELALPSYAVGLLRPADGGPPVLLVTLPAVASATDEPDRSEPALGEPVLHAG